MSLVNHVKGDRQKDQTRYVELLRADENTPENAAELRQLMTRLHRTDEQVAIDASTVRRFDRFRANLRPGLKAASEQGRAALAEFDHETPSLWDRFLKEQEQARQQWKADRDRQREPLQTAFNEASMAQRAALESLESLRTLRQAHPDLFAHEPVETVAHID